jgi:hypothetical protein
MNIINRLTILKMCTRMPMSDLKIYLKYYNKSNNNDQLLKTDIMLLKKRKIRVHVCSLS